VLEVFEALDGLGSLGNGFVSLRSALSGTFSFVIDNSHTQLMTEIKSASTHLSLEFYLKYVQIEGRTGSKHI